MTFTSRREVRAARKPHICDFCGRTIAAGSPLVKIAGVYEDGFFSAKGHGDCIALWDEAYHVYADWNEGMPFDLHEAIGGDEAREIVQREFDQWRGDYPHVITRLELGWQKGDIAYADSLRARGIEPHPDDYEGLHS